MEPTPPERLAGVTTLSLAPRRGPRTAFLVDPHRLVLPCWALALEESGAPATLVTVDRHVDLCVPERVAQVPDRSAGLRALDQWTRWELDLRNVDHVVAAMAAGLVGDVLCVGRTALPGALGTGTWQDPRGRVHHVHVVRTWDALASGWGTSQEGAPAAALRAMLGRSGDVLLDVDLDAFTTPCDADPTSVLPWDQERVREFLFHPDHAAFWEDLLPRVRALTLAREPAHCGGVLAAGRLLEDVAQVLFREVLGVDLP